MKPVKAYIYSLLILTIISHGCSVNNSIEWLSFASPNDLGFSADSLTNIELHYVKMIKENKIPGAVALVAKDGKIIYELAIGNKDITKGLPVEINSIFRLASMTKPITTVAIMQLYEQGLLKIEDPVSKYIPSFKNQGVVDVVNFNDSTWTTVPANREVTIHDLLTHTSGLAYGGFSPKMGIIYSKGGILNIPRTGSETTESAIDKLGSLPLSHQPGEKFTYGLSTDVLGRIVEVVSGKNLEEYVLANITLPLRINDTRYFFRDDISDRLVCAYRYDTNDSTLQLIGEDGLMASVYSSEGEKKYFSGGGGMSGTLRDYFVFSQALLNGGIYKGVRILKDETVELMFADHLGKTAKSELSSFGYGFAIERERDEDGTSLNITRLGWLGAYNTWFSINPTDNIIAISMSQVILNPFEDEVNNGFIRAVNSCYTRSK